MAEVQTVSADQKTGHRGWVNVREDKVLITSVWFSDVIAVHRREEDGLTQVAMRTGTWFATTASVAETLDALGVATVLWESASARKKPAN